MFLISPLVTFLCLSISFGRIVDRARYPRGPQGPDFANQRGALKVDLLERGIQKYWNVEERPSGYVNNELQQYRSHAVHQDYFTGAITIKARKESYNRVTSGKLNTNGKWNTADLKATKLRGYLEFRVKFPAKTYGGGFRGSWPAVWMLGSGNGSIWPGQGGINIMETINGNPAIFMTLHSTHHHGGDHQHPPGQPLYVNADFSRDGAIVGLEWNVLDEIGQIDITWWISYYDLDKHSWNSMHTTKTLFKNRGDAHDYSDFYDSFVNSKGFYAIVNLAEGGSFPQCYEYDCVFVNDKPQYVVIDSAKVYGI